MKTTTTLASLLLVTAATLGGCADSAGDDDSAGSGAAISQSQVSSADLAKICRQKTLALSSCKTISSRAAATFNAAQQDKVKSLIEDSTATWGDSIYEGDVDGNEEGLQSDAHKLVRKSDGALLGYKVRFSYVGWETSCATNDDYDRAKPETYAACKKGRIYQTLLVSADLANYEVIADAELILSSSSS